MKRSQMVLTFQDIIQQRFGFEDAPLFLADALLTAVEQAGMLPPIESGRTVYDLDLGIPEWEPEHE